MMQNKVSRFQWLTQTLGSLTDDPSRPWSDYPCIDWPFAVDAKNGRGKIGNGYGKSPVLVYRKAFEVYHNRKIADGVNICHHCDRPLCFRPSHLFEGSQSQNIADCRAKGRNTRGSKTPWAIYSEETIAIVKQLHRDGVRPGDIAAQTGTSKTFISQVLHGVIWRHVPGGVGALKARETLTPEDVREIRRLYSDGYSQTAIHAIYSHVSMPTIHYVVYRKSWKHVV